MFDVFFEGSIGLLIDGERVQRNVCRSLRRTVPLSARRIFPMKFWSSLWLILPVSLFAQTTVTSPPSPTTISVDATKVVRTLDPRFYGINLVIWDNLMTPAPTPALVDALHQGSFRFPGGSLSDDYNWATHNQPSSNYAGWPNNVATFAQYIEVRGAQAIVTVNYGSGTPQMAAALVAYLNGTGGTPITFGTDTLGIDWKSASFWANLRGAQPLATDDGYNFLRIGHSAPFNFKYFEVGNECYGTWENDLHGKSGSGLTGVAHDPYTYAQVFATFQTAMHAVDSTIHIGAVATQFEDDYGIGTHSVQNPTTSKFYTGWTPVMLATMKAASTVPDFLIYHYYPQNPGQENDNALLQDGTPLQTTATDMRQRLNDYLGSANAANVELLITEINSVSSNPGKQTANLVNGLFYADAFGNIAQTEFNAALWWDLHNGENTDASNNESSALYGWRLFGCYDMITGTAFPAINDNTPLPTYYAAKMMTHWARGGDQILSTTSNYTWLSAFGAKLADGTLAILVVNKNPTTDVTAKISLTGYAGTSNSAIVYTYGKPNDAQYSATPDITQTAINNAAASFNYTFPSYSITVIQLTQTPTAASIITQPTSSAVVIGDTATFSVAAAGTGAISYQWYRDGAVLSGQNSATLTIANVQASDFGSYYVVVSNDQGSVTSTSVTLSQSTAHLSNVSMRASVATGPATPIVGIIISGSGTSPILVRALGPALLKQGLTASQALPDPSLSLYDGASKLLDQNNNWSSSIATQMAQFPAVPLDANSLDAALIENLAPGGYTLFLQANAGTGVGLIEMDSLEGQPGRLTNISGRANVGTGPNVLIAGFIISGSGTMNVLVRGLGPSLTARGVNGALTDPMIKVYSGQTVIAQNDNWASDPNASVTSAAITKVNATALNDKEAAIVLSLAPGGYTVIESGVNSTTGVGLAEVFEVP